jgi:hypothetical protein
VRVKKMRFKAFLSYSHAADGNLAPAVQSALHSFARPWYRVRTMWVFRDKTGLSANPALWKAIETALADSEYFLLMASPKAAASQWVQREVEWWLTKRSADSLLILLTEGEIRWDPAAQDWDWVGTTALPPNLRKRTRQEPFWVDLRWARSAEKLTLRHAQFRGATLDIAATLMGAAKESLDSEDIRVYRRNRSAAYAAVVVSLLLAAGAAVGAFVANRERILATSRQKAAEALDDLWLDPRKARREANEAVRMAPTDEANRATAAANLQSRTKSVIEEPGHAPVASAAFSSDGLYILTSDYWANVCVWSRSNNALIHCVKTFGAFRVSAASIRDNELLLPTPDPYRQPGTTYNVFPVQLWNVKDEWGYELARADFGPITSTAWSVSTGLFAFSSFGQRGYVVSVTKETTRILPRHPDIINSIHFSNDGEWVATSCQDGHVRVFRVVQPERTLDLRAYSTATFDAEFSPSDPSLVITAGQDGTARLWHVMDNEQSYHVVLAEHKEEIRTASFSPDGSTVITASIDGTARLWNARSTTPVELVSLSGHRGAVTAAAFSPDGKQVITSSIDGTARIWDVSDVASSPEPAKKANRLVR